MVDLTFVPKRDTDAEEISGRAQGRRGVRPAQGHARGCTEEPLVSIDFNHNPASSTVDLKGIKVIEGKLVRVASWYDNEWGFSNRMCDTAALMAKL